MTKRSQFASLICIFNVLAVAQQPHPEVRFPLPAPPDPQDHVMFLQNEGIGAAPIASTVDFVATEMTFDGTPVKGLPFSAEASNEFTQTLSDGNRIMRKSGSMLYRDGEGRTRRETTISSLGASGQVSTVIITDPVAQTTYLLDNREKTARKLPVFLAGGHGHFSYSSEERRRRTSIKIKSRMGPEPIGENTKKEDLGKQNIEGVLAEGTRTTTTIPAGAIGNDRAIQIVHERWYSPDLKQVILSKHTDPRAGETVYRLSRVQRTAPASSLFEIPADYSVKSGPEIPDVKMFRRERGPAGVDRDRPFEKIRKI